MITTMYTLFEAENGSGGIPWWLGVILIVILLVLLWLWFGREEEEAKEENKTETVDPHEVAGSATPVETQTAQPDDLKKIEGIGPKVAGLLNEAGITTYRQLADTSTDELNTILIAAGLQMINTTTWSEQAQLAAAADWQELSKLQEELKGGRRVG